MLGHGAGGRTQSTDLVGATRAAGSAGPSVGLLEQPYRVAGRRSLAPASQLDAAWLAVVSQLREGLFSGLPILTGGRSLGARVACRTAATTDSVAVLCLAFPLYPPGRSREEPPTRVVLTNEIRGEHRKGAAERAPAWIERALSSVCRGGNPRVPFPLADDA